jgi:hypothetical protein
VHKSCSMTSFFFFFFFTFVVWNLWRKGQGGSKQRVPMFPIYTPPPPQRVPKFLICSPK